MIFLWLQNNKWGELTFKHVSSSLCIDFTLAHLTFIIHLSLSFSFSPYPCVQTVTHAHVCMLKVRNLYHSLILLNHSLPYFLIWVSHWAWSSLVKLLWVVSKPWGDPPFCVSSEQGLQVRFFFLGCWRVQIWSWMTESFSLSSSICTLRSSIRNIRRQSLRVMT